MGEAPGETAAKREHNSGCGVRSRNVALPSASFSFAISLRITQGRHIASLAGRHADGNEAEVLNFRYSRTVFHFGPENCAATANSTSLL